MFAASVFAAGAELRADHPDTYVVKKGDTLWDISARFLNSPWYWPEIWQANPQIENPHLIYPGDVLSLVYIDGSPHLVVDAASQELEADIGPQMRDDGDADAIPSLPYAAVRSFLSRPRMLSEEDYDAAPYVMGLEEDRLRATDASLLYVRNLDEGVEVGQRMVVVRPTLVYRDVPDGWLWERDKRRVTARAWPSDPNWHWSLKEWIATRGSHELGREVLEIGNVTVSAVGDPGTVYVSYADMEIRKGDLLLPVEDSPYDLHFYPRPPKSVPDNMRIVALTGPGLTAAGPYEVVVLTRGAQDGIEPGEVFSIYQPGHRIQDEVAYPKGSLRAFFNPRDKIVNLPDEFIGHVMVFRTFDHVSYGLVMSAVRPVYLGAILREPTEIPGQ
jgi:hypothetical protein